ncbi:MAG: hypothetical protein PHO03_01830 [Candidatus Omnitrophica bacterium]|jgi:hypothetical protein|nr:hypothetical protein [Candidatus Omnitrophota bacterium]
MVAKDFERLFDRRVGACREVMIEKAKEYASEDDRLHNFERGADFLKQNPSTVCLNYMTKHLVSIYDIVQGEEQVTQALLDEKIGDAINYLILLEACLVDEGVFCK